MGIIIAAIGCLMAAVVSVILGFVAIFKGIVPFIGKVFSMIFGRKKLS